MRSVLHPVDVGLDILADVAAGLAGQPTSGIATMTRELLGDLSCAVPRSGLNNDGFPAQLCVTIAAASWSARMLVDPGAYQQDLAARYDFGLAAVRLAARLGEASGLLPACLQAMDVLLPADLAARSAYLDGFVWVGVPLGGRGCALFVDCTRGGKESWARLGTWLGTALPDDRPASELLRGIRGGARLMCAGIEGVDPRRARLKVYWRLAAPGPLAAAGDEFADEALRRFIAYSLGRRSIQLDGVVLCAGWSAATGAPTDVKADLCGHCLARPGAAWRETVTWLAAELIGADPPPTLLTALTSRTVEVAYLGFGVEHGGGRRLNVYLRPAPREGGEPRCAGQCCSTRSAARSAGCCRA